MERPSESQRVIAAYILALAVEGRVEIGSVPTTDEILKLAKADLDIIYAAYEEAKANGSLDNQEID